MSEKFSSEKYEHSLEKISGKYAKETLLKSILGIRKDQILIGKKIKLYYGDLLHIN